MTLRLQDWRLPAEVSPNDASHWSRKHVGRKTLRELGWGLVKQQAAGVQFQRARLKVTLRVCRNTRAWRAAPGYRPRDEDNALAALKGFFDGIVQAGLLPDDASQYLTQGGIKLYPVKQTRHEGLLVTVEELEMTVAEARQSLVTYVGLGFSADIERRVDIFEAAVRADARGA